MPIHAATVEHMQFMIVGALIIFFLIVEPHGLARLWQIGKQKLRVWPFPVLTVHTRPNFRRWPKPGRETPPAKPDIERPAGRRQAGINEGRNAMRLQAPRSRRGLSRPCWAPSALASRRQAQDSIYVPLLTYRTGPFAGSRHPDRQRHGRLPRRCSTSATAASAA